MPTLKEISDNIAANLKASDDFGLKQRAKMLCIAARATLLRREYDRTKRFRSSAIQQIWCIPVIRVDESECCDFKTGCTVSRTEDKVPKMLQVKFEDTFNYVGSADLLSPLQYSFISPDRIPFMKFDKFTKGRIKYTLINDYIYIFNNPVNCKVISARYPLSNPLDINKFKKCDDKNCFDEDTNVFIDDDMSLTVEQMVMENIKGKDNSEIKIDE